MVDPITREILNAFWKVHVLHHAESRSVYGLWLLEELAEHGYRPSPGTLYPLLARMERNGWLRAQAGERQHARRNYRITREGRRVLAVLREDIRELYREVVLDVHPQKPVRLKKAARKRL
jgi:DNA-binding PadR family transcriptional regulator